jgi:hypothetical protein
MLGKHFAHDGLCLTEAFMVIEAYCALVAGGHVELDNALADAFRPLAGTV